MVYDKYVKQAGYKRRNSINATMSTPRRKNAKISDFFFTTKIGNALLVATVMLTVGIIPAVLISMAP